MITLATRAEPLAGAAFAAPCYRIPAIAITASGRIVVAYDVRADHLDLPGDFDIVLRASDDRGRTWAPPSVLRRHEPGRGFGDASLTFDPATGRLWCWYVASTGQTFWDDEPLELWTSHSDDDGRTWTHQRRHLDTPPGSMFASSGNGIVLRTGRLVQPMVFRPAGTTERHAAMALSDDHGTTWRLGLFVEDCDETKVVELSDGRVLLHGRANPRRKQAWSSDGAETFTTPEPHADLPDPSCNGGLALLGDGRVACTLLDPGDAPIDPTLDPTRGQGAGLAWGRRANLVVRTSADGGATWRLERGIDSGDAAYSVAAVLPDGRLGVVWERGIYDGLAFDALSA